MLTTSIVDPEPLRDGLQVLEIGRILGNPFENVTVRANRHRLCHFQELPELEVPGNDSVLFSNPAYHLDQDRHAGDRARNGLFWRRIEVHLDGIVLSALGDADADEALDSLELLGQSVLGLSSLVERYGHGERQNKSSSFTRDKTARSGLA